MAEHELALRGRRAAVDPDLVFLEAYGGAGMLCNPEAIFRALLAAPDLRSLRFVWAVRPEESTHAPTSDAADNPRVRFVRRRSPQYYRALGRARVLVNNATFPQAFAKRTNQVYLNTWHGTPLKAMGYDMPGGAAESVNIVRNLLAADFLLAPNERTEQMYLDAYRLRGMYQGALLRVGTPRIDRNFADPTRRSDTVARLRADGVHVGTAQDVVVFAPTWRGSFERPDDDWERTYTDARALADRLEPGHTLLLKVHQRVYSRARADPRAAGWLVPNVLPTNDLLAVTSVLVSDYSSILVDFLTTGRPMVVYAPDAPDYQTSRGLYAPLDELPGPVVQTVEDVARAVNRILDHRAQQLGGNSESAEVSPAYRRAQEQFCPYEDGQATQRVLDAVFRGAYDPDRVERPSRTRRTTLLLYTGGMQVNGVTSSALSLLRQIDHERYDVTVTYPAAGAAADIVEAIDGRARLLPLLGGTTVGRITHTPFPLLGGRAVSKRPHLRGDRFLTDEWRRCFADTDFDAVINFGGYSAFFAELLLAGGRSWHSIWLHNDIHQEMTNHGRSPWLRANLRRMTALYPMAQRLVSVSPALEELNSAHCLEWGVDRTRSVSARNTVDAARIRELAAQALPVEGPDRPILPAADGVRTFVTVGRLTQAKNHRRLLAAFASVHTACPDTRLLIVGSGTLLSMLRDDIRTLDIADAVILAGEQRNPYNLMARSDCFVLSSDYEGQPIVLLEALILGLPIITTDFASVGGALPPGVGSIVARDVSALAAAMHDFLDGRVRAVTFDAAAYNEHAMSEFYRAVGPEPGSRDGRDDDTAR